MQSDEPVSVLEVAPELEMNARRDDNDLPRVQEQEDEIDLDINRAETLEEVLSDSE